MGGRNMHYVMSSLGRVKIELPLSAYKEKVDEADKEKTHALDPYDLSLLLTIAYRQHDKTYDANGNETNKDVNWLCYGDKKTLSQISRMSPHKLLTCKKFLSDLDLITYSDEDWSAEDFKHVDNGKKKLYKHVYHLNFDKLSEYYLLSHGQKQEQEEPQGVPIVDPGESHCGPQGVHIVDPKITLKDNIINNNSDDDDTCITIWQEQLAPILGCKPEEIDKRSIRKYLLGKDVKEVINLATSKNYKQYKNPVGGFFADVKKAKLSTVSMTLEEMKAQFAAATKGNATPAQQSNDCIEAGWRELVEGLELQNEAENLHAGYVKAMARHAAPMRHEFVTGFRDDLWSENGGSFEAIRAAFPSADNRKKLLKEAIEKAMPPKK